MFGHKFLAQWLEEKWTVGQYTPTASFQQITNHSCVCKPDLGMIALAGPADCEESQKMSDMFSASPEMMAELEAIDSHLEKHSKVTIEYGSVWHNQIRTILEKARGTKQVCTWCQGSGKLARDEWNQNSEQYVRISVPCSACNKG